MKNLSNSLRKALLKMGFIKRTLLSLALGLVPLIGLPVVFEVIYDFFVTESTVFMVASLVLSQVWLYKPAADKVLNRMKAAQEDDLTQQSERQSVAEGAPTDSSTRTTLEEEIRDLGDDFSVSNEEMGDEEEP